MFQIVVGTARMEKLKGTVARASEPSENVSVLVVRG